MDFHYILNPPRMSQHMKHYKLKFNPIMPDGIALAYQLDEYIGI